MLYFLLTCFSCAAVTRRWLSPGCREFSGLSILSGWQLLSMHMVAGDCANAYHCTDRPGPKYAWCGHQQHGADGRESVRHPGSLLLRRAAFDVAVIPRFTSTCILIHEPASKSTIRCTATDGRLTTVGIHYHKSFSKLGEESKSKSRNDIFMAHELIPTYPPSVRPQSTG